VRGTVGGAKPLAGTLVRAYRVDATLQLLGEALTDMNGRFRLALPGP
jgi:hypothetical protein